MSEQAVLWAFGILIAINGALVGIIWRSLNKRLDDIDTGALASFVAKDSEREKAWWEWRAALDSDRRSRHDELTKRLDAHAADLRGLERRLTRLERNGEHKT